MLAYGETTVKEVKMGRQVFRCAVFFAFMLGFVGCATYPPPVILPDKATNFQYQYSVDIPKGWDAYEKFPKDLDIFIPQSFKKLVSLVMVNKTTKGIIVLANDKKGNRFKDALYVSEYKWKEIQQKLEKDLRESADVSRYESQVFIKNVEATYQSYQKNQESFKSKPLYRMETDLSYTVNDSTIGFDWFIYPCHGDNFCQTIVMLACEMEKFEMNRPVFNSVVESLTMHDVEID
jgi:hypothetical protein